MQLLIEHGGEPGEELAPLARCRGGERRADAQRLEQVDGVAAQHRRTRWRRAVAYRHRRAEFQRELQIGVDRVDREPPEPVRPELNANAGLSAPRSAARPALRRARPRRSSRVGARCLVRGSSSPTTRGARAGASARDRPATPQSHTNRSPRARRAHRGRRDLQRRTGRAPRSPTRARAVDDQRGRCGRIEPVEEPCRRARDTGEYRRAPEAVDADEMRDHVSDGPAVAAARGVPGIRVEACERGFEATALTHYGHPLIVERSVDRDDRR